MDTTITSYHKTLLFQCHHPQKVKVGCRTITVPCGHCSFCRHQRSRLHSDKIRYEAMDSTLFYFTLSFSSEFAPRLWFKFSHLCGPFEPHNKYVLSKNSYVNFYFESYEGKIVQFDFPVSKELLSHLNKYYRHCSHDVYKENQSQFCKIQFGSKTFFIPKKGFLLCLDYSLVKLFLKSLRKAIWKDFRLKFRFTSVGEYGGKKLRPHYHFLLFFPKLGRGGTKLLKQSLSRFLGEFWKYGKVDFKGAVSPDDSLCSYLSNYVCSNNSLPVFFRCLSFRQRIFHSLYFGYPSVKYLSEGFYRHPISYIAGCVSQFPSDSFLRRYVRNGILFHLLPRVPQFTYADSQSVLSLASCVYKNLRKEKGLVDVFSFDDFVKNVFSYGLRLNVSYSLSRFFRDYTSFSFSYFCSLYCKFSSSPYSFLTLLNDDKFLDSFPFCVITEMRDFQSLIRFMYSWYRFFFKFMCLYCYLPEEVRAFDGDWIFRSGFTCCCFTASCPDSSLLWYLRFYSDTLTSMSSSVLGEFYNNLECVSFSDDLVNVAYGGINDLFRAESDRFFSNFVKHKQTNVEF